MSDFFSRIQAGFQGMVFGKKVAALLLLVIAIAGTILTFVWSQQPDYQVLFSKLSATDSAEIVTRLKQQRIPYELASNGKAVMVPSKHVYELRMQMASEGFPQNGNVGFEIFDKSGIGVSEFVQKLNFKRAIQGELVRTINQLVEVESSRVHIVNPEKSLFVEDQEKTTASIMLKLKNGMKLQQGQIKGIVHLVASSIEGLNVSNITVIDVHGEMLYGGQSDSLIAGISNSQFDYKQTLEKTMEEKVQSMLARVVGYGNVIVRVTADLEFKQIEKTEEKFDPESQVARSEQRSEETSNGGGGSSGLAGIEANVPGGGGAEGGGGSESARTDETINYELNKVVTHIKEPVGSVKRLSVAVVVDGVYEVTTEGEGEEQIQKSIYKARTPEEMKQFEKMVKTAVGATPENGYEIKVENIQFHVIDMKAEEEAMSKNAKTELWKSMALNYGFPLVVMLLLLLFIIRPLLKWIMQAVPMQTAGSLSPGMVVEGGSSSTVVGEGETFEEDSSIAKKSDVRKKVHEIASSDPDRTAEVVRKWLKER